MGYTLAKTIVAVIVLLVLGSFISVARWSETCVVCRLTRAHASYGPFPITRHYENNCSRWYAANVEARHDHLWERGTCVYETNLYGLPRSVGCRPGHYPIWRLSPDIQMRVYQHFANPLEARTLFSNLTDAKTHDDRLDEDDEDKGQLTVRAMWEWEAANFPGVWPDWWARFYTNHVIERKDWREWLKSDSGLAFDEWRQRVQLKR